MLAAPLVESLAEIAYFDDLFRKISVKLFSINRPTFAVTMDNDLSATEKQLTRRKLMAEADEQE